MLDMLIVIFLQIAFSFSVLHFVFLFSLVFMFGFVRHLAVDEFTTLLSRVEFPSLVLTFYFIFLSIYINIRGYASAGVVGLP